MKKPSEFILERESEWEEQYDDVEFATEEDVGNMYVELDELFISREEVEKDLSDQEVIAKYGKTEKERIAITTYIKAYLKYKLRESK